MKLTDTTHHKELLREVLCVPTTDSSIIQTGIELFSENALALLLDLTRSSIRLQTKNKTIRRSSSRVVFLYVRRNTLQKAVDRSIGSLHTIVLTMCKSNLRIVMTLLQNVNLKICLDRKS